jgi:hypothetical protein
MSTSGAARATRFDVEKDTHAARVVHVVSQAAQLVTSAIPSPTPPARLTRVSTICVRVKRRSLSYRVADCPRTNGAAPRTYRRVPSLRSGSRRTDLTPGVSA